jgi:hypothetical protein
MWTLRISMCPVFVSSLVTHDRGIDIYLRFVNGIHTATQPWVARRYCYLASREITENIRFFTTFHEISNPSTSSRKTLFRRFLRCCFLHYIGLSKMYPYIATHDYHHQLITHHPHYEAFLLKCSNRSGLFNQHLKIHGYETSVLAILSWYEYLSKSHWFRRQNTWKGTFLQGQISPNLNFSQKTPYILTIWDVWLSFGTWFRDVASRAVECELCLRNCTLRMCAMREST